MLKKSWLKVSNKKLNYKKIRIKINKQENFIVFLIVFGLPLNYNLNLTLIKSLSFFIFVILLLYL